MTWVVIMRQMPAMQDAVETTAIVAVADEVVAKVPVQLCLGRHQRLVHARI